MELVLEVPVEWERRVLPGRRVALVPGYAAAPDVLLAWGALGDLPDEQRAWVGSEMRNELPPGAIVMPVSDRTATTAVGWPVRLVEATVHAKPEGPATEWRLVAFYAFFEHGAVAHVRASSEARYREQKAAIEAVLLSGSPDWSSEPAALAELWDVTAAGTAATFPKLRERVIDSSDQEAVLRTRLAALDVELAAGAKVQAARGDVLRKLGENEAALAAYRAALADNVGLVDARFGLAGLLAASGDERGAIAEWDAVAAADVSDVDALFNIGLARYRLGEFAEALAAWDRAAARAPSDFWIARKRVQALYALGTFEAAGEARARVKQLWRASRDRAVQLQDEIVFDQFVVGAVHVHAAETLRERGPEAHPLLTFRAVDIEGGRFEVAIETSEYARQRGTPYVLSVLDAGRYHAIGTQAVLPPYIELKATVTGLVEQAIATRQAPKAG